MPGAAARRFTWRPRLRSRWRSCRSARPGRLPSRRDGHAPTCHPSQRRRAQNAATPASPMPPKPRCAQTLRTGIACLAPHASPLCTNARVGPSQDIATLGHRLASSQSSLSRTDPAGVPDRPRGVFVDVPSHPVLRTPGPMHAQPVRARSRRGRPRRWRRRNLLAVRRSRIGRSISEGQCSAAVALKCPKTTRALQYIAPSVS